MTLQTLTLVLAGFATAIWLFRPLRFVHTQGFANSIYWTARSWIWNYPVTSDFGMWEEGDPSEMEKWMKERKRIIRTWHFLGPFFATHGYNLYIKEHPRLSSSSLIPPSKSSHPGREARYPYAQYACKNDAELAFYFTSPFVWPARDRDGREVVIKAIAGNIPTNELRAFQLLHSNPLCNDPRNHTIPILEKIEFNKQIFAVMPRWSMAIQGDFVTIDELIRFGYAFLEAVAFLHNNKIAHGDILTQNMLMDILAPEGREYRFAGYRGPDRRYALIDFETAVLPDADGSYSPEFERSAKRDVHLLAHSLGTRLRCIEHIIPQIGSLLDSMKQSNGPSQPTAEVAFAEFKNICENLTEEVLSLPVQGTEWSNGVITYRNGPPVYREP